MPLEFILGFQILADIVLCLTIIFLIWVANKEIKNRPPAIDKETVLEFGKLIEASRCSTDDLLQALNEVKKIGYDLDEKEKRLRALIKETDAESVDQKTGNSNRKKKYADVIKMAGQGLTEKQIADRLNITEGETCLILNLHQKKHEDFAPGNRNS